tara:strand:+ start:124 stop:897 length:774 start_codon:yes stop_codon:yes gene_type:complete
VPDDDTPIVERVRISQIYRYAEAKQRGGEHGRRGDKSKQRCPEMTEDTAKPQLGLRERNKRDKARRIREAARELFLENGFDAATTRQIAQRADVGLGTLFSYVSDKRDLLFLIYNEDQPKLTKAAFEDVPPDMPLLDQLVGIFGFYYRFFAQQPELGRFLLRELTFYVDGDQAARFQSGRREIVDGIEALVFRSRERGTINTAEDSRMVARIIFAVYQAEIRRWLQGNEPEAEAGLETLRRVLGMVFTGLAPGKNVA